MRRMTGAGRAAAVITLALILGGSAAIAQGGGNWGQTGATPPKLVQVQKAKGPHGTLPAAAQAALERIREAERGTGRTPPAPMWNHATNDYERNPDGSVKFIDTNRTEPPPPPCLSAPGGCGHDYNSPPPAFCARLPKGCER
jgi:hypothetical protein